MDNININRKTRVVADLNSLYHFHKLLAIQCDSTGDPLAAIEARAAASAYLHALNLVTGRDRTLELDELAGFGVMDK